MNDAQGNINLRPHLRFLLTACHRLGFTHFTYSRSSRRFKHSQALSLISRVILSFCRLTSGFLTFGHLIFMLGTYMDNYYCVSFNEQEMFVEILNYSQIFWRYLSTFLVTSSCLANSHLVIPILNEMLELFDRISGMTDDKLYFPRSLYGLVILKLNICVLHVSLELYYRVKMFALGDVCTPFGLVLQELVFWSQIYANLVLTCFYLKMSGFLTGFQGKVKTRKIERAIARLLAITFRIHRLKDTINRYFTLLCLCTYLGVVNDIRGLFELFRYLLYIAPDTRPLALVKNISTRLLKTFVTTFDVYLIAHLSEMSTASERAFRRELFLLFGLNQQLQRVEAIRKDIDLLLMEHRVCSHSTRAFRVFLIDRHFSFSFFKDVILGYSIVCLQLFISSYSERNRQAYLLRMTNRAMSS